LLKYTIAFINTTLFILSHIDVQHQVIQPPWHTSTNMHDSSRPYSSQYIFVPVATPHDSQPGHHTESRCPGRKSPITSLFRSQHHTNHNRDTRPDHGVPAGSDQSHVRKPHCTRASTIITPKYVYIHNMHDPYDSPLSHAYIPHPDGSAPPIHFTSPYSPLCHGTSNLTIFRTMVPNLNAVTIRQ
jgi:hypothetical protein